MYEVLILAAIALFVLSRLYAALGRDDGPPEGRKRSSEATEPAAQQPARPGPLPQAGQDGPVFTGPAAGGLEDIHRADRSFDPRDFLAGAKAAYRMIVEAFARGDRDALKPLLDDDVYEAWDRAITAREADGTTAFDLLRMKKAEIEAAELDGSLARVSVRYEAELGDGERTRTAREVWLFKRDVTASDPNWLLDDVVEAS